MRDATLPCLRCHTTIIAGSEAQTTHVHTVEHALWCADSDLGGFWRVVDLAQGGVALVHVTCWGRTTHVGGPGDARLQDYQVSFVRCHRFVTVTAAQKISFISNPRAGRPVFDFTACSRARAGRGHMATRWVGGPFFVYCCKTGDSNTAICSGSSEMVLCSRQNALERCKSKYSVVCSSLNTPVWPAGRRFEVVRAC